MRVGSSCKAATGRAKLMGWLGVAGTVNARVQDGAPYLRVSGVADDGGLAAAFECAVAEIEVTRLH